MDLVGVGLGGFLLVLCASHEFLIRAGHTRVIFNGEPCALSF